MGTKDDLQKYPLFVYENGIIRQIEPVESWNPYYYNVHHFIKRQSWNRNETKYKTRGLSQKLFLIPVQMHLDIHSFNSKFKDKWGIELDEVIWRE